MESKIAFFISSFVWYWVGNESLRAQVLTVNLHRQPVGHSWINYTVIFIGIPNGGATLTPVMNITMSPNNISASKRLRIQKKKTKMALEMFLSLCYC